MIRVAIIVFVSGASALTYEVLWQRELLLVFGASAPATAAVLTAIFLGIALGSRLAPNILRQGKRPILALAALEAVMGLWGTLVRFGLNLSEQIYVSVAPVLGEESGMLSLARFILAILPLLPSTLCMGATIPVMVAAFDRGPSKTVSWIYGLNILGAVAGTLTTGLIWIRVLGQTRTSWVAIGMNSLVVLLALSRLRASDPVQSSPPCLSPQTETEPAPAWLRTMYFLAGFVAVGLEVVWLRYLGIVNTNSTVTFALTLAVYLLGMGVGSLVCYPLIRRWIPPYSLFGMANGGVAFASLATFPVLFAAPLMNRSGIEALSIQGTLTLADIYRTEAAITFLLLFVPTLCMGMVYPAVCDSGPNSQPARRQWVADAYFAGMLGSVAGTIGVSLWFIPVLGLNASFAALVTTSALLCALSVLRGRPGLLRTVVLVALGGMVVLSGLIAASGRPILRSTEARKVDGRWLEYGKSTEEAPLTEIVRFKAGASGTVIVKRDMDSSDNLVYVDDQLVASTNIEAKVDAFMLAHLPLLLHPDPKDELTVGFGSGGTSHAITTHGIDAYCVEIEPEVVRSASLVTSQNYGILEDPLFHLILNDARDHLKITQRQYDVIATDMTNLQYKQNSSLYTVEYFQLMKQRLRPGGVASAWIPMAAISKSELQILMKSFQAVFPHATLWFMNHTHTNFGILIGTSEPLLIDYARIESGFKSPSVAESLKQIGLTEPMQIVYCLHLDSAGYAKFCGDKPLHTDNFPILEFSSPLSFYQYYETFLENLSAVLEYRPHDYRKLVVNGPPEESNLWEQHRVASQIGCQVICLVYQFEIARARGNTRKALQILKQAIQLAEQGMKAWPEDRSREAFYVNFFETANQWALSTFR